MAQITVYNVVSYDILNDTLIRSKRMATIKGAARMRAEIVKGSGIEIDATQLEPGEEWTVRGFDPNALTGFQTRVF